MTRLVSADPADALPPRKAARDKAARVLDDVLGRFAFAARVQELGALPKLPRLKPGDRRGRRVQWIVDLVERRLQLRSPALTPRARWRAHAAAVVGMRLATGQFRKLGLRSALDVVEERVRRHEEFVRPAAGFVDVTDREDPLIRAALMLRLLKRPGAAADLLVRRFNGSRPATETRRWLAFLLREAGEGKAAPHIEPRPTDEARVAVRAARSGAPLTFGVVMTTLLDGPVFRRSLRSLLESDYRGEVVVVEDGGDAGEACRGACDSVGAHYVKMPTWVGSAAAINAGIERLDPRTDLVIFCHNDVLWPPEWFAGLERAWQGVWAGDRVSLLNLGYIQLKRRTDPALYELFLRGRYDDLVWLLRHMREVPSLMEQVQDAEVRPGERPFGLARDPWIDSTPALRFQSGRFSVAASFPRRIWAEMGGFDPDLVYAFDLQMLQHSIEARRWTLFVNTPPLVHLKSTDTRTVSAEKQAVIGRMFQQTYETFQRKYGWQIEHYLNLYFSESVVVHQDAIIAAANSGRFSEVDLVFDDFRDRLGARRLSNCELMWCRSRAACPYV